jgi:hypothetical protein
MNNIRKFISGRYEGTRLEIMASKPATHLPNGTPIVEYNYDEAELSPAQVAHRLGNVDVHAPQQFHFHDMPTGLFHQHTGPSVAQEWKILARGERPFYRYDGVVQR